jgi:hypothetical protein
VEEEPADVYVYRDTSGPPNHPAAASPGPSPDEHDAAYWYDLTGEAATPVLEQTRGPFEPLVSSTGPPGITPRPSSALDAAESDAEVAGSKERQGKPDEDGDDASEDPAHAQARKLEQIKDFYLTAEAIGEEAVDKHFDRLLAQQRELISEYFKQSTVVKPYGAPAGQAETQAETEPDDLKGPGAVGGQAAPESAGIVGEQPRIW